MNRKKRKLSMLSLLFFVLGLVTYLIGILLLFSSSLRKVPLFEALFSNVDLTKQSINSMKLLGVILFFIGFIIFMIAVILLYNKNEVKDDNRNLIIEGKADVITLIIMTYVMIFMIVICLLYDEFIGALLFGFAIIIQTVLNNILLKYFSKEYKRK